MTDLHLLPDRIVLALTIWGEARSEPVEGQIAVANVVRNRLKRSAYAVLRWRDICLAPLQFSCFNDDDQNRPKIERAAVNLQTSGPTPELAQALWIADGVMAGAVMDNTKNANHYLTAALLKASPPRWAKDQPVLVTIGAHVFLDVA